MSQTRIDKLAKETYFPVYKDRILNDATIQERVKLIVEEEKKRPGLTPLDLSRGIRTRVSELLQSKLMVVDPPLDPKAMTGGKPGGIRAALDEHHDHQTGHFQAIWQLTDALVQAAGVELEKAKS